MTAELTWEALQERLRRVRARHVQEVADGVRDARSLMVIPDHRCRLPVKWPEDAFGPLRDWDDAPIEQPPRG